MLDNAISLILWWLLIGSALWAALDPKAQEDQAIRAYLRRNGRLPGNAALLLAHAALIVFWPRVARAMWEGRT